MAGESGRVAKFSSDSAGKHEADARYTGEHDVRGCGQKGGGLEPEELRVGFKAAIEFDLPTEMKLRYVRKPHTGRGGNKGYLIVVTDLLDHITSCHESLRPAGRQAKKAQTTPNGDHTGALPETHRHAPRKKGAKSYKPKA